MSPAPLAERPVIFSVWFTASRLSARGECGQF